MSASSPKTVQSVDGCAATHEAEVQQLRQRLASIRQRIVVLSGKGGVGKSTVSVNLAMSLAMAGYRIGLLDIDIHGPSIPKLLGLDGCRVTSDGGAIPPAQIGPSLKVMSIGFLLRGPQDAVVWRGPLKYSLIRPILLKLGCPGLESPASHASPTVESPIACL